MFLTIIFVIFTYLIIVFKIKKKMRKDNMMIILGSGGHT
jgi:hypothetical protein